MAISLNEINDVVWRACDTFRGAVDPAEYKLNIPRYADTFEKEKDIDISAVEKEINQIDMELQKTRAELNQYFKELGFGN